MTDRLNNEPNRANPSTETEEPKRTNLRTDRDDPI
jgi:hypothetical protein